MLLKYFYDQKLAHASYLVGCQANGQALIVDPGRDVQIYLDTAAQNGMKITAVAETHIHADYVSGAREIAERTGAKLYVSDEGDVNWKYQYVRQYNHQLVKDGDKFKLGNLIFEVLHTPGHTPEHISFLLTDGAAADRPMGIFTGDFVFVGSVGRPDLLEKAAGFVNTALIGARQQFHSVNRFKQLPDYLQVWPAHGAGSACGKGLGSVPSTTVGYEKMFNPMLAYGPDQEEQFVADLLAGQPEAPYYFAEMKRVNKEGPAVLHGKPAVTQLAPAHLTDVLGQNAQVIDTRPVEQFAQRHLAGTINIPLAQLSAWAGWLISYQKPVYLIVEPAGVATAVRDLAYIGLDQVAGYFEPAAIWHTGLELQTYQVASPKDLADRILKQEVLVVDVRAQTEWDEGHLPHAQHVMLGHLLRDGRKLINGHEIVVQCRSGNRSAIGASIIQALGAKKVTNMAGGIAEWSAAGLPVVKD